MNKSINNKRKIVYIIAVIIGLIFISFGIYYYVNQNKYYKHGDKVQATVDNILDYPDANSETYEDDMKYYNELLKEYREMGIIGKNTKVAIIINFTHNGVDYTKELGYFSDNYKIADTLTIYVNKNDSTDFIVEGRNQFGIIVCFALGGILVVAGICLFFICNHNSKCNVGLLKDGKIIEAEVLYADTNEKKESFGRHPNVFTCVYKDPETNAEKYFTSDSIYSKNLGTTYIGKKVKVYVDPNNDKNYYVDSEKFEKE